MKKKYVIIIVIAVIIIASTTGLYFLKKSMDKGKTSSMETYTVPSVEKVFVNGVIEPEKTKEIYLDPSKGNVDKVFVKNDQIVKKGDNLFVYKDDKVNAQVDQIELQLETAKNQKKELLKQKESSKKQLEELKKESAKNPGSIAGKNVPMGNAQEISTESIDSQINLYEKQIKSLKDKEYKTITAPISGKVILHNSNSKNNMASPYITIESTDFYMNGTVNEKDQPRLKKNQDVDITIVATNKKIKGKISKVSDTPTNSGGMDVAAKGVGQGNNNNMSYYEVNIELDTQKGLTNGFHVQGSINLDDKPIEIPKKAVLKNGDESYVFKKVDGKLVKQVITYSSKKGNDDVVIVNSGLVSGDEIISNADYNMKEGMSVE
ncbi:efflux RND transporter periplasmic adaptor subunit [Eubacterium multiforme]|uniref:HlyD family secretion protein n=1 Tax=Eubacterium multiforme TaxID=83339 RepID=A0ABT9URW6_9FIRM|nr:efflux RND transporter periplasmic adaptor subunit [Eubacterium multiforme]MDQ0148694.1 HlyD family secretion protein [Eubacterium multiforme]